MNLFRPASSLWVKPPGSARWRMQRVARWLDVGLDAAPTNAPARNSALDAEKRTAAGSDSL